MNCPDVTFELDPVVDFEPRPAANTENSEKQSDGVHIWDALAAISSTITDQSKKVVETYSKEVGNFLGAVKEEATEALHIQEEAVKSQFGGVGEAVASLPERLGQEASSIFKLLSGTFGFESDGTLESKESVASFEIFDADFLTMDHAANTNWESFKLSQAAPLLPAHKDALLSNDPKLKALFEDFVPDILSENKFWESWQFFIFTKRTPTGKSSRSEADWDSWDNEELMTPRITKTGKLEKNSADNEDDWDEWA